jgi:hypothetical protein
MAQNTAGEIAWCGFGLAAAQEPKFVEDRMPLPGKRRLTLNVAARVTRMGPGRASNKEGES